MGDSTTTTTTTTPGSTASAGSPSKKKRQSPEAAEEQRLRDLLRSKVRKKSNPEVKPATSAISVATTTSRSATNTNNTASASKTATTANSHSQEEPRKSSLSPPGTTTTSPNSMPSRGSSSPPHGDSERQRRRHTPREGRRRDEGPPGRGGGGGGGGGGRGPPPPHHRHQPSHHHHHPSHHRGGPGRWERGHYQHAPPPRDRHHMVRGGYDHRRGGPPPPRGDYDSQYSKYATPARSSRSPSPRGYHHRDRDRGRHCRRSSHSHSRSRSRSGSSSSRTSRSSSRSSSRSLSRSYSRSRSRSRSASSRSRNGSVGRGPRNRGRPSRSHSSDSASSSGSSSSSSSEEPLEDNTTRNDNSVFTKDQRTVFVSQLVMRTTEKDIRRYFRRTVGCYVVRDVILLRDKRTGNHKGCAYVEFGSIDDVNKAVAVSGQPPNFQRFPLLVKPSESEKNYAAQGSGASTTLTASMMGKYNGNGSTGNGTATTATTPLLSEDGKMIEAQKVYVGGLDPVVSEEHIFALFSQFGQLEKVTMQMDPATKVSRGYAFLSFRDPKEAYLAIQTMNNQILAGRAIKTGWASQVSSSNPGVKVVTSTSFPDDAAVLAQKAITVLAQLSGLTPAPAGSVAVGASLNSEFAVATTTTKPGGASAIPTVAEARANLLASQQQPTMMVAATATAATPAAQTPMIGGLDKPTTHLLVHNMFDKDEEESGTDWPVEIKEDFIDECSKFGTILSVTVMSQEPGGKIFATFDTVDAALKCAKNLAGRWFDKRQLRVDFCQEEKAPPKN